MPPTAITTTIYAETLCHTVLSGEPTSRFRLKCLGGFRPTLHGKRRFMQNERILTLRGATQLSTGRVHETGQVVALNLNSYPGFYGDSCRWQDASQYYCQFSIVPLRPELRRASINGYLCMDFSRSNGRTSSISYLIPLNRWLSTKNSVMRTQR
ncbi:hypothetical protein M404DRAFT_19220 [Pisolithus tinctorius Marx 270]|uniref:Uncharacterized protein n=1 Tax=Pisolithus tinctorius Marx 270 TaxID=870435 RepID=A0A0C3PUC1_PISTI|nr:hypothetical protein M404DRAFT_19220 [Pisolithus tinctorius Marx 270]